MLLNDLYEELKHYIYLGTGADAIGNYSARLCQAFADKSINLKIKQKYLQDIKGLLYQEELVGRCIGTETSWNDEHYEIHESLSDDEVKRRQERNERRNNPLLAKAMSGIEKSTKTFYDAHLYSLMQRAAKGTVNPDEYKELVKARKEDEDQKNKLVDVVLLAGYENRDSMAAKALNKHVDKGISNFFRNTHSYNTACKGLNYSKKIETAIQKDSNNELWNVLFTQTLKKTGITLEQFNEREKAVPSHRTGFVRYLDDDKLNSLCMLAATIRRQSTFPNNPANPQEIEKILVDWEKSYSRELSKHSSLFSEIFSKAPPETIIWVKALHSVIDRQIEAQQTAKVIS